MQTQEIFLPGSLDEATTQKIADSAPPKPSIFDRIALSPVAFMIYGSLMTITAYLTWLYLFTSRSSG